MYETLGVGLQEFGFEGGRLQWLMMVEFVFDETSFIDTRGVLTRGASSRNMWTSQL